MKFFVLLAFAVVFLTVFTRADDEAEEEDDDGGDEPQAVSSALQLNGNNVGDINNIKGEIEIYFLSNKSLRFLQSNCSDLGRRASQHDTNRYHQCYSSIVE